MSKKKIDLSGFDQEVSKTPKRKLDLSSFDSEQESFGQDLGDFAKSVGQGMTLGGGDEIMGALEAGGDVLTGDADLSDILKKYREHQQANEKEWDAVKERSPILSTAGEIGGGFLLPGGALIKAGKGVGALGKAALAGLTGATAGGLSSKGTIEGDPSELGTDMAIGSALGFGLEGATQIASPLIKSAAGKGKDYLKQLSKEYDLIRQGGVALDRGLEGKGFISKTSTDEIKEGTKNLTGELVSGVESGMDFAGKKFKEAITSDKSPLQLEAQSLQKLQNLKSIYENPTSTLSTLPRAKSVKSFIQRVEDGQATMEELQNLKNMLNEDIPMSGSDLSSVARNAVEGIDTTIQKKMGELYPEINKTYAQSRELGESLISNVPEEFRQTTMGEMNKPIEKLYGKSADIVKTAGSDAGSARDRLDRLEQLKSKLEELKTGKTKAAGPLDEAGMFNQNKANPELLEATGFTDPSEISSKITKQADLEGIMQLIQGNDLSGNRLELLSLAQGKRGVLSGLNVAGQATKRATEMGQKIYKLPADQLGSVAQSLKSNPATAFLGNALEQSINNPAQSSKNAILFSIMQNPDARQQIGDLIPGEVNE